MPRKLPGLTAVGKDARTRTGHEAQLSLGGALRSRRTLAFFAYLEEESSVTAEPPRFIRPAVSRFGQMNPARARLGAGVGDA